MKGIFVLVLVVSVVLLLVGFVATCNSAQMKEQAKEQTKESSAKDSLVKAEGKETVKGTAMQKPSTADEVAILETNYGTMVLEFFPKDAPGHVENFKKLARQGFYDGTKFHRIVKGFMIQGGDPNTKGPNADSYGTGNPGYTIKAEFNARKHLKGTLSMARSQDPNSAGSQFFVCLAAQPGLDGKYTVFGQLVKGMDVLDAIGNVKVKPNKYGENSVPVDPVILKKVTIVSKAEAMKVKKTGPEEGTK
jgi:peptidyl-prolyl cis-trans isomerase B (cyclophilin B)